MKNLYFILLLILGLSSCHKKSLDIPDIVIPKEDTISVDSFFLWTAEYDIPFYSPHYLTPQVFEDDIIYSVVQLGIDEKEIIISIDKYTGDLNWKSEVIPGTPTLTLGYTVAGDYYVSNHRDILFFFDARTGNLVWAMDVPEDSYIGYRITSIGGEVYTQFLKTRPYYESNIVKINPATKAIDTIYTYTGFGENTPEAEIPVLWMNPQGDSILIMQDRSSNYSKKNLQVNIMAINKTKKKLEWVIEKASPTGNSAVYPAEIVGDEAVFALDKSMLCVDLLNGKIKWWTPISDGKDHLLTTRFDIAEGKIYLDPHPNENIEVLDLETGEILERWGKEVAEETCSQVHYRNGILFKNGNTTYQGVSGVDVETKEKVWSFVSPMFGIGYSDSPYIIDDELNAMIIWNKRRVECIMLPE